MLPLALHSKAPASCISGHAAGGLTVIIIVFTIIVQELTLASLNNDSLTAVSIRSSSGSYHCRASAARGMPIAPSRECHVCGVKDGPMGLQQQLAAPGAHAGAGQLRTCLRRCRFTQSCAGARRG